MRDSGNSFVYFVLAMARHALGSGEARACYRKAVAGMSADERLQRLKADTERALGIE
ncbi:MAG: hypothetical protein ACYS0E_04105 [Planctomycetota bacterium]